MGLSFGWAGSTPIPNPRPDLVKFTIKTAAALAEQVAIARSARRFVAHRVCPDAAPCKFCAAIRNAHRSIDDHLTQLEAAQFDERMKP